MRHCRVTRASRERNPPPDDTADVPTHCRAGQSQARGSASRGGMPVWVSDGLVVGAAVPLGCARVRQEQCARQISGCSFTWDKLGQK